MDIPHLANHPIKSALIIVGTINKPYKNRPQMKNEQKYNKKNIIKEVPDTITLQTIVNKFISKIKNKKIQNYF